MLLQQQEEEQEEKEVEHGKNGENIFGCNLNIKWSFQEIFGTQFICHVLCSTDSLEVIESESKNLMYGGNTKTIAIMSIQYAWS